MDMSSVFSLIHEIHAIVTSAVDTSLTWEQLNSPTVNYTLVRPTVAHLLPKTDEKAEGHSKLSFLGVPKSNGADGGERGLGSSTDTQPCLGAVLYALMANRMQFVTLADADLSSAPLQSTRAAFCELLAMKFLRKYPRAEDDAELTGELVRGFCAFGGAPEDVWQGMGDDREDVEETRSSALELAIVSSAKHFLSLPVIQHLVHEIYIGHLIYSPSSPNSLISDSYISERTRSRRQPSHSSLHRPPAPKPVTSDESLAEVYQYNPYDAGWLDHTRLRVPKWRKWLEFTSFAILLVLFIATLSFKNLHHPNAVEIVFIVFTAGFMLDEFAASKEHGWTVYSANTWNVFDLAYIVVFLLYLILRIIGLSSHSEPTSDLGFDILACGACILFPRLVFFLIKDNVVILALKSMIARFVGFMGLVILAFSGICFCLWTLGRGTWTVRQITWLMLQIWFGSSYLGFSASESFHPIFGPIILISYAALCNTLLITILISILSNEFAVINANAQEEHLFQRVVKTVEGVKSDAVFSYLPPLNLVAFIVLTPLSWVASPRTLHRINVFGIRLTGFPFLLAISGYERWQYRSKRQIQLGGTNHVQRPSMFDSFLGGGTELLISSVFEAGPGTTSVPEGLGGKKASRVAVSPSASPQRPSKKLQSADTDSSDSSDTGNALDSPLAKAFGPKANRASSLSKKQKKRKARRDDHGPEMSQAGQEEVDALKKELGQVRESQLRMEELLSKVLAGSK